MRGKENRLYIFTGDNRILFYSLKKDIKAFTDAGKNVTVMKKSTVGDPGFIGSPNLRILRFWPLFFGFRCMLRVIFSKDRFPEMYVDDERLSALLSRLKPLHKANVSLLRKDPEEKFRVLDVGCGGAKTKGAIGVDGHMQEGIDAMTDLNRYPWPFKDDSFDFSYCISVIEHLDNVVKTMEELHRIGKNGSVIIIDTTHYAHPNSYRDPTHKWHFTLGTFDYFTGEVAYPRYSKLEFKMLKKELRFRKKYCLGKLYAFFSTRRYEKYYCHKSPPHSIYFEMEIVK